MTTSELSLFKAAFLQSWNAIVITDADASQGYGVVFANPAFCTMTGYSFEELRGRPLKMLQGPDTDPMVIADLRTCLQQERYFEGTTYNYRKDGSSYVVHWNISPVRDENGKLTHFVSVQQDISEFVRVARHNQLLARALDATSDPVVVTDAHAHITFVNSAFSRVTGYPVTEVMGKTPAMLRSGQHDEAFYANLRKTLTAGKDFRATFINRRRDGSIYHAEQSISPVMDEKGRITHFVSVTKDISDRVEKEQGLIHDASHDTLTDLYNRRFGEQVLSSSFRQARARGGVISLILCDIDHFKQVNDRFGHPTGDRVIVNVAKALRHTVRGRDAVIRWGGEDFLVLLDDCPAEPGQQLAERMRARVEALQDEEVGRITLSLGLATLAADDTLEQLIERADTALYAAKQAGRNRVSVAP